MTSDGFDLEKLMADTEAQLRRTEEVQQQLASLTGAGTAGDGLVTAGASAAEGLNAITIEPRAMRLSSQELGELVLAAARAAIEDLQTKTMAGLRELVGDDVVDAATGKADPMETIARARAGYDQSIENAMSELDRLRRQLGGR